MGYLKKNTETYPTKYKKALLERAPTKIQLRYVVFRWLHTYELH